MSHYTFSYQAIVINAAAASIKAAMAAVPIPPDPLDVLGLTVTSDATVSAVTTVTRTIELTSTFPSPVPASQVKPILARWMKPAIDKALSTITVASPVVVT